MKRARWNGVVIAEADRTVQVEGNDYFPPESLHREYFIETPTRSLCPWKGIASYYAVTDGDEVAADAAWTYRHPSPLARRIKNHVAFWGGVVVEDVPDGDVCLPGDGAGASA
ncbi:DUF427 domain-containing protein [Isoptericola halotolerans]|uniref:DUF427 domain-containing protein n=1 Tax=Isoptericola halotolerans TaxID=300560 RepID=UPI00388D0365